MTSKPADISVYDHTPCILWEPSRVQAESDCACSDIGVSPRVLGSRAERQAESDCACSSASPMPPSVPNVAAGLWQATPHLYRTPLAGTHELIYNPIGPVSVAVLNRPASRILDAFAAPRPLEDETSRQMAALGLLTSACRAETARPLAPPRALTAWLHVTNACNLRCHYCYLRCSKEAMRENVGLAAIDAVFRSALAHGFQAVKLKYAGGEPTLHWPLIPVLHAYAQALAMQHGLELYAVVLTNGTALTDERLAWLRSAGVRLMISLDGIGLAHDAQRPFADGCGSFARVARNIDRALTQGLVPYLSITVTPHNADRLADTVAFALDRDLPFNLNFVREPEVNQPRLIAGIKAALAVIEGALPRRRLMDIVIDRSVLGVPHEHPCDAGRDYLVIDPHGRVARCQMTMDRPVTEIWADDPLQAVREQRDGFQNVSVDEKEGCRECIWRYWCAGGCPLLAYRATGRSDVPSPYCAVYKALYPDVVRLEGLRLLKWHLPAD